MRKLRIDAKHTMNNTAGNEQVAASDRKIRGVPVEIGRKADILLGLKARQSDMKRELKAVELQIDQLQSELLAYGKEHALDSFMSESAAVVFRSATERKIDPKAFLTFLQAHGRTKDFYDFVSVPITQAIKNFGEAVLETSGVLLASSREYAGLKVTSRK